MGVLVTEIAKKNTMKKTIIIPALLLFSIFAIGCENQPLSLMETKQKVDRIEIIDFHSTRRCASCMGMERNAKATLEKYFKKELESRKITFQTINVEESNPQTATLVQKYQATGSSLFINVIQNGEDHIEQDVGAWRYARQNEQFQVYFREKISNLLK